MKRTIAALAIAAALTLTACSPDAPEAAPQVDAPPAPSAVTAEQNTTPPAEAEAPADGQTTNDRGNLTTTIGQKVSPFDPNTASVVGTFTITSVVPSACTTDAEPENGKFLTLAMDAEGAPAADNPDSLPFYANSGGGVLTIIKADGTTWGGVPTTSACLPSEERLPASIGVGEKYSGYIVLDVPEDAAVLVFKPTLGLGYELNLD